MDAWNTIISFGDGPFLGHLEETDVGKMVAVWVDKPQIGPDTKKKSDRPPRMRWNSLEHMVSIKIN